MINRRQLVATTTAAAVAAAVSAARGAAAAEMSKNPAKVDPRGHDDRKGPAHQVGQREERRKDGDGAKWFHAEES